MPLPRCARCFAASARAAGAVPTDEAIELARESEVPYIVNCLLPDEDMPSRKIDHDSYRKKRTDVDKRVRSVSGSNVESFSKKWVIANEPIPERVTSIPENGT